jgi:transcriptional regulator with XRE-family HTH domain
MSFREQRKKAGLTQLEVAKLLEITDAAVNQWETGKTMPSTKRLTELAKLYGCTVDELLKEE